MSDDSTHGIAFAPPPDKFLYDVFIALGPDVDGNLVNALDGQPTAERGKIFTWSLKQPRPRPHRGQDHWSQRHLQLSPFKAGER